MTRILLVDDKDENLYYLRALLSGHGFEVETAHHGAEALSRGRQHPPDLVVSDLLMPVMDGYTLLRHWKADVGLKSTPFVVYTATYTSAADEQLARSLGADAFILKPAEPEDFLERIREVLSSSVSQVPVQPPPLPGDAEALLKVYSETLIRKLEEKTLQLEETNRAMQRDLAERRSVEERLRESEERFRATFEQAAVGIAHVATDGTFLRVNDKLCELLGYPRDELMLHTFRELSEPEDRAQSERARVAMIARTQSDYSTEKRYRRKDGRLFWANVLTTLLWTPAGQAQYFITVVVDVTERKLLQEQLLRAQRMESIGALAGGIAHDLNNLLTPVLMGGELLRLQGLDADSRDILDSIETSARHGANLVQQLLTFARGSEGARVAVHLGHVVHEIERFASSTFPKNITLRLSMPTELWPVFGDPTQLNQVLLNLCVNACDAMSDGGTLSIIARNVDVDAPYAAMLGDVAPGRYVMVEVSDTGTGIPDETRARIFEPFFTTKEASKGTGLGLSTVREIMRTHNGHITVTSVPGKGSTFQLLLPATDTIPDSVPVTTPTSPPPLGDMETVLVSDDDPVVLDITVRALERSRYRVLAAKDGAQALAVYAVHRLDIAVVLTDMAMPGIDGATLITALRRIDPAARIIATSGIAENESRAMSAGANHFLSKPFSAATMLRAIATALHPAPEAR